MVTADPERALPQRKFSTHHVQPIRVSYSSEMTAYPKLRPSNMSRNASPLSMHFVMCSLILSAGERKNEININILRRAVSRALLALT